ncbi:MAG: hypothetical protein OHK0038_12240 [Flammeovirgaceae bacterium]
MKLILISTIFLFIRITFTYAQSANIQLDKDYYHLIDRYEIRQGKLASSFMSAAKPYQRKAVAVFADSLWSAKNMTRSRADRFNLAYLSNDNWEFSQTDSNDSKKAILKYLYLKTSDFYHVSEQDFDFHFNPVWHFTVGKDNELDQQVFINSRGFSGRGKIGDKVAFYFYAVENQARFASYVQQKIAERGAIPSEGFWKREKDNVADFFTARGYVQLELTKQISAQFGHDKNFVGNGYRSLILSDFAEDYTFLRFNTKVWKFQYTNIFAQMIAKNQKIGEIYPKKYMALHHLSLNLTNNLNVGLFESVMFSRQDSTGNNRFDVAYLNPIIFYRALEHDLGDPDNVILGADFKWNFLKRFQLYGQFVLDELIVKETFNGNQWWGNKQAVQLGAKWIDVAGISNLDIQGELNIVRPYTYTHSPTPEYSNYQHYEQPLAHPLGANFREIIGVIRYQPIPRLQLIVKGFMGKKGEDANADENYGGDIFKDYNQNRPNEYGVKVAQGVGANWKFVDFTVSYQVRHNLFLDFKHIMRNWSSSNNTADSTIQYTSFALRWNVPQRLMEF